MALGALAVVRYTAGDNGAEHPATVNAVTTRDECKGELAGGR